MSRFASLARRSFFLFGIRECSIEYAPNPFFLRIFYNPNALATESPQTLNPFWESEGLLGVGWWIAMVRVVSRFALLARRSFFLFEIRECSIECAPNPFFLRIFYNPDAFETESPQTLNPFWESEGLLGVGWWIAMVRVVSRFASLARRDLFGARGLPLLLAM